MDEAVRYDTNGYDDVTKALIELVNQYPALDYDEHILFAEIDAESGMSFIPSAGAAIVREVADVTGHVSQDCVYTFSILYKAGGLSETRRINTKEFLDDLGRWLGRQPIEINGEIFLLAQYPTLTQNRELLNIQITSPSFLSEVTESNVETWLTTMQATYRNEFDR